MKHLALTLVSTAALLSTLAPAPAAAADACIQVPVDCRVTSTFGPRYNPITKTFATEYHKGVDFGCAVGTPVKAAALGVVGYAGTSTSAGEWISESVPGGLTMKYMHNVRLLATRGMTVSPGSGVISYTGSTGRSTGPHLHFQVEQGTTAVDPYVRFCTKPPLKDGVLQGADTPVGDIIDAGGQANAPTNTEGPHIGLDGSLDEVMADVIASRALNPDYVQQLSTLSEPRLYAELAYMQTIRLKIRQERILHKERMLATAAMVQILMTERTLKPQLDAQRRAATQAATMAKP